MSRVLVTGAGGFVGSHLALGLAQLGFEVVASDREFDNEATTRLAGLERLTCEVSDLDGSLGPIDGVIHGAAITAQPEELAISDFELLEENLQLTLDVLKLAQTRRVKRFIFLSSAGVFDGTQEARLDETSHPLGSGSYATAKRMGELATQSLRASGALDTLSVRLGNLYGPDERPRKTRPRMSLVARLLDEAALTASLTLTTPEALREWTQVQDLAPALARLLEHPAPPELVHLCAPHIFTDRELAEKLRQHLPGTRLELRPDLDAPPVRPPLESRYAETLSLTHWTHLDQGLERLVRRGVPA